MITGGMLAPLKNDPHAEPHATVTVRLPRATYLEAFAPIPGTEARVSLAEHCIPVTYGRPLGELIKEADIANVHSYVPTSYVRKTSMEGIICLGEVTLKRLRFTHMTSAERAAEVAATVGMRLAWPEEIVACAKHLRGQMEMKNLLAPGQLFEHGVVGTGAGTCEVLYLDEYEGGKLHLMTHDVVSREHLRIEPHYTILVASVD